MGLLETFSRKFGFTMDDEDENEMPDENEIDEDEEEEDDEEEESGFAFRFPSNPFKREKRSASAARSRVVVQRDEEDEEPAPRAPQQRASRSGNVIHDPRMQAQSAAEPAFSHCERIVNVRQIEECREIIKCLLRGESILLNLEHIDPKDCGRVVDLLSGAAFALQGRMLKVAHLSYLLAPENVEVIENDAYMSGQARYM